MPFKEKGCFLEVFFPLNKPTNVDIHIFFLGEYLEDHPMTCRWLITMGSTCPE